MATKVLKYSTAVIRATCMLFVHFGVWKAGGHLIKKKKKISTKRKWYGAIWDFFISFYAIQKAFQTNHSKPETTYSASCGYPKNSDNGLK